MKGFERKRPPFESDAEECRQRGFKPGDKLAGNEGFGVTVIVLTAIGERSILAKEISHDGRPESHPYEISWTLSCRDWEKIA